MRRSPAATLQDIVEAIRAIGSYTRGGREAFDANAMQRDAVVARLIQIGQAVKDAQAGGLDLSLLSPGIPWRSIAGMRDKLAHRYWVVDTALVWTVVETDLPKLAAAVREILATRRPARKPPRPRTQARKS